jgi:hypothetical protein
MVDRWACAFAETLNIKINSKLSATGRAVMLTVPDSVLTWPARSSKEAWRLKMSPG